MQTFLDWFNTAEFPDMTFVGKTAVVNGNTAALTNSQATWELNVPSNSNVNVSIANSTISGNTTSGATASSITVAEPDATGRENSAFNFCAADLDEVLRRNRMRLINRALEALIAQGRLR